MKRLFLFLIIVLTVLGFSLSGHAAPVYNPSNGHMYDIVNGNWVTAEYNAIALGGHLVTINDADEQNWLLDTFGSNTFYWIGLNDIVSDNHYEWTNGEPVTFTNWEREYDNNSDKFDWIEMNYGGAGKWNYFCLDCASSGIAEWKTNSVPEPATFMLLGLGLTTLAVWRMRRNLKPG